MVGQIVGTASDWLLASGDWRFVFQNKLKTLEYSYLFDIEYTKVSNLIIKQAFKIQS